VLRSGTLVRMLAAALWLVYAVTAYPLWMLVFRVRYGFWPVARMYSARRLYDWMDFGLFLSLMVYTVWIALGRAPVKPISVPAGAAVWASGCLLRAWAIMALGKNWRMGQDEKDEKAEFVASGPYRLMHHPINAALILVAIGQALMTGLDGRAVLLLATSVVYFLVQGRAEEEAWEKRRAQSAKRKEDQQTPPL